MWDMLIGKEELTMTSRFGGSDQTDVTDLK